MRRGRWGRARRRVQLDRGGDALTEAFVVHADDSAFAFLSYRYLLENHVPMIGGGYDGDYYGKPGNESIFSALGAPFGGLTSDGVARIMQQRKATKVAALSYSVSASSTASAKLLQQYAVPAFKMKDVYTNTSVEFGTSDVGPLVLGIKNAGATPPTCRSSRRPTSRSSRASRRTTPR